MTESQGYLKTPPAYVAYQGPESSDWRMRVCGITYVPTKGNEPCWFHRLMQRWAFGFRWERRG